MSKLNMENFFDVLVDKIKTHEGFVSTPYKDGHGWSYGYGHNVITNRKPDIIITEREAEELLIDDLINIYIPGTRNLIPHFKELDLYKQLAFIDMTYNMGIYWLHSWPNTKKALENKDYKSAAKEIQNSKYYNQVGYRAKENIELILKMEE